MHAERLSRLIEEAGAGGFDALAVMPGPNLFYLTGMSFHLSERPVLLFIPLDRPPALVAPGFEAVKADDVPFDVECFTYTDEEGYEAVFRRACDGLGLSSCTIGAEAFKLRMVELRLLEQYALGCQITPAEETLAALRMRKDAHELAHMRRAIEMTEGALEETREQIAAGMTERQVATILRAAILQRGGEGMAFGPAVQAGANAASPHASPGDDEIQPGDTIVIDCGTLVNGYASDITRTFAVGEMGAEMTQVYEVVRAANAAGRGAVRPGISAQEVDRAARRVIEQAGYGAYFNHRTGHGLGLEVHEPPYIVEGNERLLEPGMTFTVEPGIYLPGQGGVRIEDDVLVTADGGESLTTFPREFRPL
ncbi:MAG TPA: aminopeptidase P family protein [Chloroflexi bacterium]|nr:aminopeptidase P family protein [Chloroflexota bacterium]